MSAAEERGLTIVQRKLQPNPKESPGMATIYHQKHISKEFYNISLHAGMLRIAFPRYVNY